MNISLEVSYKSLCKQGEELCGDKLEIIKTEDSDIIILSDGMGSGVKANILATLTSKILGTMLRQGARLEDCVDTIAKTLPVCSIRKVAYSTFSILQIFGNGKAYLVEYDNPGCVFVRGKKIMNIPYRIKNIEDKTIREYYFDVQLGDYFVLFSDGVVHAGTGNLLSFGWGWQGAAEYVRKACAQNVSSPRLVSMLCRACKDLYMGAPGDDTTVATVRIMPRTTTRVMVGPASSAEIDGEQVRRLMAASGKKIVCGGTTSKIVARELGKKIDVDLKYYDDDVPPTAYIEGVDLVTEGILTLSAAEKLMEACQKEYGSNVKSSGPVNLEKKDGATKLVKMLVQDCTDIVFMMGQADNPAHQNIDAPINLSIKVRIIQHMAELLEQMGKKSVIEYY